MADTRRNCRLFTQLENTAKVTPKKRFKLTTKKRVKLTTRKRSKVTP